ncbi:MAG TPA: DNA repair protein RadC [Thermoanaerobaculia bacterium]
MKSDDGSFEHRRWTSYEVERHLHALLDAELLAIVLAAGCVREKSVRLGRELLAGMGGLFGLPGASAAMLRHGGLRDAQASALLASREIASRLALQSIPKQRFLASPRSVARYLLLRYQQRDQEVMGAVFLNVRHRIVGDTEVFRGTLHRAEVEPREILKECLLRGAAGVVIFHTHPSGDPTPSDADLQFTKRMAYAAALVGVDLVDHLVLGAIGRWVSLRAQGGW